MTLKVTYDDGRVFEVEDVFVFDFIDKEYIENVAESINKDLTEEQIKKVGAALEHYEDFPDSGSVYWEIKNLEKPIQ